MLSIAGSDRWIALMAGVMLVLSAVHLWGLALVPWWILAALFSAALVRASYLLACRRADLLMTKLWRRACQIAGNQCPKRGL